MSGTPSKPRPLALLAGFLLGLGFASRILVSPAASPVVASLPTILLLTGAGLVLLERGLEGGAGLPFSLLLLLPLTLPGFFPLEAQSVLRGFDLLAIVAAGLALRELVLREGLGPTLLRSLLALALLLALLACAQALFQRAEAADYARSVGDALTGTARGRAFLASRRAAATFINANVFAGFLLLVLPLALAAALRASRPRGRALGVTLLLGAAFVAAASAGATLALAAGAGALLVLCRPLPAGRWRTIARTGGAAATLGIALLAIALASGWEPPLLGAKIATFGERLDYHRIGFRLLPEMGLFGAGLGATADIGQAVARPGEAWSAFLHDSWLQLLIEVGPLMLIPLVLLVRALLRAGQGVPAAAPPQRLPGLDRAFQSGVVLGAAAVPLVVRMVTLLPTAVDLPLLDAALAAAVVGASLRLLAPLTAPGAELRGLLWALAAFCLHNLIDFDLYLPGCALAFAASLALLPGGPRPATAGRRLAAGVAGLALVALPLLLMPIATRADEVAVALRVLADGPPESSAAARAVLSRAAESTPVHLDALRPALLDAVRRGAVGRAEKLLDRLSPALRERPATRRAEAAYLQLRALADRSFAVTARTRITQLIRDREIAAAELWYRRHVVDVILSHPEAAASARAALELAAAWDLDDDGAPYLAELRRHLEGR